MSALLDIGLDIGGYPTWAVCFAALIGIHTVCFFFFRSLTGSTLAADASTAAHFLPQLTGFVFLAYYGSVPWLTGMPDPIPPIGEYVHVGARISHFMIALQMYELAACVPSPKLRGGAGEMVMHHVITLMLSVLGYHYTALCAPRRD